MELLKTEWRNASFLYQTETRRLSLKTTGGPKRALQGNSISPSALTVAAAVLMSAAAGAAAIILMILLLSGAIILLAVLLVHPLVLLS